MKLCQFSFPARARGSASSRATRSSTSPRPGRRGLRARADHAAGTAGGVERRLARPWPGRPGRACRGPSWTARRHRAAPHLLAPLDPPEIWGAGITYRRSREYYEAHTGEGGRTKGIYDYVYEAERPSCSSRRPPSRMVGPSAPIRVRRDSR